MLHRSLPFVLASFALTACVGTLDQGVGTVGDDDPMGGGGGGGGDDEEVAAADAAPEPEDYALVVSPALGEIDLGDQMSFTATVSSDNYAGPVTLELSGALPSWEITYSPSQTLSLLEDQSTQVVITITVPTNGDAGSGTLAFALDGELGTRASSAALNVANRVTVGIAAGAGEGGHGLGGAIAIKPGTDLVIVNNDTINHRIHAEPHQEGSMGTGESYTLNYDNGGNEVAYCHIHGENTGVLQISVE